MMKCITQQSIYFATMKSVRSAVPVRSISIFMNVRKMGCWLAVGVKRDNPQPKDDEVCATVRLYRRPIMLSIQPIIYNIHSILGVYLSRTKCAMEMHGRKKKNLSGLYSVCVPRIKPLESSAVYTMMVLVRDASSVYGEK